MAYTLVKSYLKLKNRVGSLEDVALGGTTMRQIFKKYTSGFFVLSNPALTDLVQLDLRVLQESSFTFTDVSFPAWLSSIGNQTLPTTPYVTPFDPNTISTGVVKFLDVQRYGIEVSAVHDSYALDIDVPDYDRTSLYLNDVSMSLYRKADRCLVSVNGYLHNKLPIGNGVRAIAGRRTWTRSGMFSVGLLNFMGVGSLVEKRLTNLNDLNRVQVGVPYRQGVIVELNQDLTSKSVMMSLGGILLLEGGVIKVLDRVRGLVKIDLTRFDLRTWYLAAHKVLDLSSLDVKSTGPFDESIYAPMLELDETVLALLALPQTFAIIVDKPDLTVKYDYPQDLNLYGRYSDSRDLNHPMVDAYGRVIHYIKFKESSITAYAVGKDHYQYPSLEYGLMDDMNLVDELPYHGDKLKSQTRFMVIY